MTTVTAPTGAEPRTEAQELHTRKDRAAKIRMYLGLAALIVWGLAPFYWMVVTSFRSVAYTFDTTPWPTHLTLDNYTTAFSTDRGNHFGAALVHSIVIGVATTVVAMLVGVFASYALARLTFPGKLRRPRRHPRVLDVPGRRAGLPAVPDVHATSAGSPA